MKVLWYCFFVLQTVFAFDHYIHKEDEMCRKWGCINDELGFTDISRSDYIEILMRLQPNNPRWHNLVQRILYVCFSYQVYDNSTRSFSEKYTNFPCDQVFLYCIINQLDELCPEESLSYTEHCAPLEYSSGTTNYLLQQRRHSSYRSRLNSNDTEYKKCCDLPPLVNSTVASRCGINDVVQPVSQDESSELSLHASMSGSTMNLWSQSEIHSLLITLNLILLGYKHFY